MDFSDFEDDGEHADKGTLQSLIESAEQMAAIKEQIEELEQTVSELTKHYNFLAQQEIPNTMEELGLKTFELKDGSKISIKDFISGSLPKDEEGFEWSVNWLKDNDLESILKTDVTLKFNKGEENFAKNAIGLLRDNGYEPNEKFGVHPQTLYSALRELQKHEVDIPFERLGLYAGKKADIKPSKK